MDPHRREALIALIAATVAGPRLRDRPLKDSPALRCEIAEAIRVAEYIVRVVESRTPQVRG